ncbi:MAG: helix-turn-helix domain-containing protein, partial [Aureliella sp.]
MEEQLTTKQAAEALCVSESSVKRWCDSGAIHTVRTVGGHRRIPMGNFLEFLERTNRRVETPTLASQPAMPSGAEASLREEYFPPFVAALERGDEPQCRQVLASVWAATKRVAYIADEFIASAFHEIGERWNCGSLEVFQ